MTFTHSLARSLTILHWKVELKMSTHGKILFRFKLVLKFPHLSFIASILSRNTSIKRNQLHFHVSIITSAQVGVAPDCLTRETKTASKARNWLQQPD